jgi:hypothetical protein
MVMCNHVYDYIYSYVSLAISCNQKIEILLFESYSEKNTLSVIIKYFYFFSINTNFFKILPLSNCGGALYLSV